MYIGVALQGRKHITITYHGHKESEHEFNRAIEAVKLAGEWWRNTNRPPLLVNLTGKVIYLGTPRHGVWATKVDSDSLEEFRELLLEALFVVGCEYRDDHEEYIPHVTLGRKRMPTKGLTGVREVDKIAVVSDKFGIEEVEI